ncbi:unnamed protein product [Ectocarpus sp. CCAP 1310/34]|nr:unnamed protein product [Ectocarpus sp. CCAP 1310/34]
MIRNLIGTSAKSAGGGDMSGDENSFDESMISRDEYEAERQDSANERAVISASVEDLKAEMAARFAEVLAAVRDRDGGAAAAGAAPAPGYGGARAAAGVAPASMYGGANAGYGLHRVEPNPGLLQGVGRYGSGGGLDFTPAISSPFGAGSLHIDSGGYGMGTGMSHAQQRMEKVISDQRVNAWSSVNSRMWWVVMGCFPPKLREGEPARDALPASPLPAFPNLAAYLRSGGLINSAVRGKAGSSSAAAAGAGGKGSKAKDQGPCYQFQRDGTCRWGKYCKFAHVAPRKAGGKGGKRWGITGGGAEEGGSKGSPSTVADTNAPAAAAPAKWAKVGMAGTNTRSSAKGGAGGGAKDDDEE